MSQKKPSIAIDSTMMDGRFAKGTGLVIRKTIQVLISYKDSFKFTLVHKQKQVNDSLYNDFNECIIPRIWDGPFGGVINELLFFISYWIKIFLRKEEKFDIYFVAYSRILPTFIFAPAKKFIFYPMDGGPLSAGFGDKNTKTPFPWYVIKLKNKIDGFLALSKFGQKGIMDLLNVPEEKAPVIYCAADDSFKPSVNKVKDSDILRTNYNYPQRYILCVSRWDPHKNILGTVEAYNLYKQEMLKSNQEYFSLVFVGGKHMPEYSKKVDEKIVELGLEKDIMVSKFVQNEDLPKAYACAEFLVFASYYEGFGLPVLEAMQSGCPVICSNNSSLEEIGGDAAIKVDPYNTQEIAYAMVKMQTEEKLRDELRKKGFVWAKQFSWEKSIEKLVQVFKNLVQ